MGQNTYPKKEAPCVYLSSRLGANNLESVSLITNLGITISRDLQWKYHIEEMVAKANKKMELSKRVCRFITNRNTRKIL